MSRKIFKKVLFLMLFGACVFGMYSFFSGLSDSEKRSDIWKGLVHNMYAGNDKHIDSTNFQQNHKHLDHVAQDKLRDMMPGDIDVSGVGRENGRNINPTVKSMDAKPKPDGIDIKDQNGNVVGHKLFAFGMSKDDIVKHRDRIPSKYFDVNENGHKKEDGVPTDSVKQTHDEKSKPDGIDIKDKNGNVVGHKLFAFGMSKDDIARHRDRIPFKDSAINKNDDGVLVDSVEQTHEEKQVVSKVDRNENEKENVNKINKDFQDENKETENNDEDKKPDAAIRDHRGQIIGNKLYAFGMGPGVNANQDVFASSRKLHHEEPTMGPKQNIRPDSAFFDEKGNRKKLDSEVDRLADFQERMGLGNPIFRHKFNPNDPFHRHRAAPLRPLGAHGMNPALENNPDEGEDNDKDPTDAFAGLDRESVWGKRYDTFLEAKPQPLQDNKQINQNQEVPKSNQIDSQHQNPDDRSFGLAPGKHMQNPIPTPQNRLLNHDIVPQRGQMMGYVDGKMQNGNIPNLNNENGLIGYGESDRNKINNRQSVGKLEDNRLSNQGVTSHFGQLMGYDNRQNHFGQDSAWNNPNRLPIVQQRHNQMMGYNRNDDRYPLNNNQNHLRSNNVIGNIDNSKVGNSLPRQLPNGFNQRQHQLMGNNGPPLQQQVPERGQLMGLNGLGPGGGNGGSRSWGVLPSKVPNLFPNNLADDPITPTQMHLEQQIIDPLNKNIVKNNLPLSNQKTQLDEERLEEKDEELVIEDLTKSLSVSANCINFPFPTGKASLCVPTVEEDENEIMNNLKMAGTWEPDSLNQFHEIISSDPNIGVIDIGAGIGVYTISAALMGRSVVAVEPLFINYRLLHKTALVNDVATKIVMITQALDKKSYIGHMIYSRAMKEFDNIRIEHLSEENISKDPANNVHVTTLNQLVKAITFKKALLKIDVGGIMEADILKSSSKFFASVNIPYILTHWNQKLDYNKKIQIGAKMAMLGYRPKSKWNGPDLDPQSLHYNMDFLVWHKG